MKTTISIEIPMDSMTSFVVLDNSLKLEFTQEQYNTFLNSLIKLEGKQTYVPWTWPNSNTDIIYRNGVVSSGFVDEIKY